MEVSQLAVSQALKRAHKALKANPRDAHLHAMLAQLYEQLGRYEEAAPHLTFLLSNSPAPDESLYHRYVKALQRRFNCPEALAGAVEGLRRHPLSTSLPAQEAIPYMMMGEFRKAEETYARICARDPSDRYAGSQHSVEDLDAV